MKNKITGIWVKCAFLCEVRVGIISAGRRAAFCSGLIKTLENIRRALSSEHLTAAWTYGDLSMQIESAVINRHNRFSVFQSNVFTSDAGTFTTFNCWQSLPNIKDWKTKYKSEFSHHETWSVVSELASCLLYMLSAWQYHYYLYLPSNRVDCDHLLFRNTNRVS